MRPDSSTTTIVPRPRLGRSLDRYVFAEFATVFAVSALGFPVLVFVLDLAQNLDRYRARGVSSAALALSYVCWLPETMFNVLPAAVLFATVFTVGAATRNSEITAAKASGISFYRFIRPIVVGAVLAMGLDFALGELAPGANARRLTLIGETRVAAGNVRRGFAYAAPGDRVYGVGALVVDSGALTALSVERQGTGPAYPGFITTAERARFRAGAWMLERGTSHVLGSVAGDVAVQFDSLLDRRMTERPRDLMTSPRAPEDMSYRELGRFIRTSRRSGADVNALRAARALKITIPLTCVIILLFGAPLATSTQSGGAGFGVGLSLGTTVLFLVLIQVTRAVGASGVVVPELAAAIPTAFFGAVGAVLLRRTPT
jgi:lipopolysaccharide export system permease protein